MVKIRCRPLMLAHLLLASTISIMMSRLMNYIAIPIFLDHITPYNLTKKLKEL